MRLLAILTINFGIFHLVSARTFDTEKLEKQISQLEQNSKDLVNGVKEIIRSYDELKVVYVPYNELNASYRELNASYRELKSYVDSKNGKKNQRARLTGFFRMARFFPLSTVRNTFFFSNLVLHNQKK